MKLTSTRPAYSMLRTITDKSPIASLFPIRPFLIAGMIAVSVGAGNACLAAPDELGRLFYTPTQRAQLESARSRSAPPHPASPSARGTSDEAPVPLRFDGMMVRSDGKTTHWIDGKPQSSGAGVTGLKPGQIRAEGRVYEPYQVLRPVPPSPPKSDVKAPTP